MLTDPHVGDKIAANGKIYTISAVNYDDSSVDVEGLDGDGFYYWEASPVEDTHGKPVLRAEALQMAREQLERAERERTEAAYAPPDEECLLTQAELRDLRAKAAMADWLAEAMRDLIGVCDSERHRNAVINLATLVKARYYKSLLAEYDALREGEQEAKPR